MRYLPPLIYTRNELKFMRKSCCDALILLKITVIILTEGEILWLRLWKMKEAEYDILKGA